MYRDEKVKMMMMNDAPRLEWNWAVVGEKKEVEKTTDWSATAAVA